MTLSGIEHAVVGAITLGIIVAAAWWGSRSTVRYQKLVAATAAATLLLIVLGAFVRLSDAGLGCPDWPGCYGNLTPHHSTAEIRAAESAQPGGPVSMAKAWKEMLHRYLAMIVGALIAGILVCAIRLRHQVQHSPVHAAILSAAVIFQAALGAWTVTMLLKPAIVTSHLLGGVAILTLLVLLLARLAQRLPLPPRWVEPIVVSSALRTFAWIVTLALLAQICLGGWTSTNYAALACSDLPKCNGRWVPTMDFANAFHIIRPLGVGPNGELLTIDALRAIHWMHRLGAVVVCGLVALLVWRFLASSQGIRAAKMLVGLLTVQVLLGISNVWFSLPLTIAVAHNGFAAVLFAWMAVILFRLRAR